MRLRYGAGLSRPVVYNLVLWFSVGRCSSVSVGDRRQAPPEQEREETRPMFVIDSPTIEDAAELGHMLLAAWRQTYRGERQGIDDEWTLESRISCHR